eukprot:gnl/TRDRNA2_/TRDRNA2_144858_c0_seq2.p1 gnl/TRDRNA2_/TRDRNA2_144858_c0~~gnl/TRDRNA2_/TRDRNA2_144858_c0_seq2.p1  ORF type:complete len:487 (-),score=69.15 gnl/TRDRNA2_/TRDRNA2_144858_c0_seq2:47-1507(-)
MTVARQIWLLATCTVAPHFYAPTMATAAATTANRYYNDLVESLPSLHGKCVAITGTTSGLGYWAAMATARKGASCLIMLNRESSRSKAAELEVKQAASGTEVMTVPCDLQSFASVREAAESVKRIAERFGGLDVLSLNAGIMTQPDERTVDGFDVMMQTNHLSHFLLTKWVMPSLHAAAAAGKEVRIVTHSSIARAGGPISQKLEYYLKSSAGNLGGDGQSAKSERYHQTKLANIAMAMELAQKFRSPEYSNFKALSAAPGVSATDLDFGLPRQLMDVAFLSAADGSCSLLTAMFDPSAESGDFYEPESLFNGPPTKVISRGVPLPPQFPRQLARIRDDYVCNNLTLAQVWSFTQVGLGEEFELERPAISQVEDALKAAPAKTAGAEVVTFSSANEVVRQPSGLPVRALPQYSQPRKRSLLSFRLPRGLQRGSPQRHMSIRLAGLWASPRWAATLTFILAGSGVIFAILGFRSIPATRFGKPLLSA